MNIEMHMGVQKKLESVWVVPILEHRRSRLPDARPPPKQKAIELCNHRPPQRPPAHFSPPSGAADPSGGWGWDPKAYCKTCEDPSALQNAFGIPRMQLDPPLHSEMHLQMHSGVHMHCKMQHTTLMHPESLPYTYCNHRSLLGESVIHPSSE